jgi:hypothetical protein
MDLLKRNGKLITDGSLVVKDLNSGLYHFLKQTKVETCTQTNINYFKLYISHCSQQLFIDDKNTAEGK